MKVTVGSKNPVKISAVKQAFLTVFPDETWEVVGIDVKSGVSDQPMSDKESIKGATNRANRALRQAKSDFGVGLEGGLQKIGKYWFDCGWIVIVKKNGEIGIGSTIKMITPERLMKLIHEGTELGAANDIVFGKKNSKHAEGHFGLMTNNALTRTRGYTDGVIAALSRFLHPHLFTDEVS